MTSLRDPRRYREEAARFLKLAEAATDSRELRDSYLALSLEYERLARILEASAVMDGVAEKTGIYSPHGRQARSREPGRQL